MHHSALDASCARSMLAEESAVVWTSANAQCMDAWMHGYMMDGWREGGREAGREGETGREPSFMGGAAEGRFVEIPLMNQRLDAES